MRRNYILLILLTFSLNALFSGSNDYTTVLDYCIQNDLKYQENLKLNYIEIFSAKKRLKLFVTMPYIAYQDHVYYMDSGLIKGEKGQWNMSPEYRDTISKLLKQDIKNQEEKQVSHNSEKWILNPDNQKTPVNPTNHIKQDKQNQDKKTQESDSATKETETKADKKEVQYIPVEGFIPINAIIIDAGHGGKDPGAIGKNGIKEKEVVLNISRYLYQYLKADKDLDIFMTRSKDVYVSLENRTQYASQKAKKYNPLFVSIHGNMSLSQKSTGIEVFSLGEKASDDQALQVEMMENEGFNTQDIKKTDALFSIIAELVRDGLQKESSYLAEQLFNHLSSHTGAKKRGLKKANFFVLKYNTVPAALVEVGFLSHPQEGTKLASPEYQKKIARGLYYGIKTFVKQYNKTKGYSQ